MKDDIEKVIRQETRTVAEVSEEDGSTEMVDKTISVEYLKIPQPSIEIKKDHYLEQKEMRRNEILNGIESYKTELAVLEVEIEKIKSL